MLRSEFKKIQTEEQLRKSLKEYPKEPEKVPPDPGLPPDFAEPPDRPVEEVVGPWEAQQGKIKNLESASDTLRHYAFRRSMYAAGASIPFAVITLMLGHPMGAAVELLVGPVAYGVLHGMANYLEKPEVIRWLSQPTTKDIAFLRQLSPQERAEISRNLLPLIKEARKQGVKVSPPLAAYVAAGVVLGRRGAKEPTEKQPGTQ